MERFLFIVAVVTVVAVTLVVVYNPGDMPAEALASAGLLETFKGNYREMLPPPPKRPYGDRYDKAAAESRVTQEARLARQIENLEAENYRLKSQMREISKRLKNSNLGSGNLKKLDREYKANQARISELRLQRAKLAK